MSDRNDHTAAQLARLGTSAVPLERADEIAARRARLVPSLTAFAEAEMARAERRPRHRRVAMACLAAALALAAVISVYTRHSQREATVQAKRGTVRVVHLGATSDVTAELPHALSQTDLLETLDGTAEVNLVTGAIVDLSAQSRLELAAVERSAGAVSERVRVSKGLVHVQVPKLPAGSELRVGTPDATVTVHGTAFTVEVTKAPEGGVSTTVVVTEGRVAVDSGGREIFLGPGSHWSSAVHLERPESSATVPVPPPPDEAAPAAASPGAVAPTHHSSLREENELFRAAMAAERKGKPDQAIALTDKLLRAHPDTPLAAEARALALEARRKRAASTAP